MLLPLPSTGRMSARTAGDVIPVYREWLRIDLDTYLITLPEPGPGWRRRIHYKYGPIAVWYIRFAVAWQSVNREARDVVSTWPMVQGLRRLLQACLPESRSPRWCNIEYDINASDFFVRVVEALLWFRPSPYIRARPQKQPMDIMSETYGLGGKVVSVSLGMVSFIHDSWCRDWKAAAAHRGNMTPRAFARAFCLAQIRIRRRGRILTYRRASSEPRVEHLRGSPSLRSRKGSRSASPRAWK